MIDIVFPDKNEKEFIEMAEKLGYKEIIFVYEHKFPQQKSKLNTLLKTHDALLVQHKKVISAKNKVRLVFVKAEEDNRFAFEKSVPSMVFALEEAQPRDFMHQRGSGLNHILCRLASQNKVKIGFSFSSILAGSAVKRAQIIGRIKQNIMLCRKYKCGTVIASFAKSPYEMRSPADLMSFFIELGMHPREAKDSLDAF